MPPFRAKIAATDRILPALGREGVRGPDVSTTSQKLMLKAGIDRLAAVHLAIELVRRGGTISTVGVYGGMTDPMPLGSRTRNDACTLSTCPRLLS